MANHYQHPIETRRDRATEAILEWLTRLVEAWVAFWRATEPGEHAEGATDRFADTLHGIDITAVHDGLSDEVGRYALLAPAEMTAWTVLDGHSLVATLDQNGGAV